MVVRRWRSWGALGAGLLIVMLLVSGVGAESGIKSLIINPNPKSGLKVRLWTDKGSSEPSYRVGEKVQLYFEVSDNAYVTIFDVNAAGKVTKLFPNSHQPDGYARKNRIYRVPDKYDIVAAPPTGEENLLIVATRSKPVDYPELLRENGLENLISRLRRRLTLSGEDWAMDLCTLWIEPARRQTITYHVQSNLSGVKLYVDGSYVGELPQQVELGPGEHQLVALKSGYKAAVREVYVDEDSRDGRWMVRLEALKSSKPYSGRFHIEFDFNL
ncbi:MAG TPA: DUF4384 domain-containing protein [Firmicutes bacterium]|nr:DUF4384 domain-containing protein [Bacillota bacterium]